MQNYFLLAMREKFQLACVFLKSLYSKVVAEANAVSWNPSHEMG